MLRCLRFIVSAAVLAVFAVATLATQSQAHTFSSCSEGGSFDKTFSLTADEGKWTILEHDSNAATGNPVVVDAMMYNGGIPGPLMEVTEGDQVCVDITNNLAEETIVHWHGINAPYVANDTDGVHHVGAGSAIPPGGTLAVHWTAPPAGTYMYHAHANVVTQMMLGLYGPIIVRPQGGGDEGLAYDEVWMLSEWRVNKNWRGVVTGNVPAIESEGTFPNYFTINGKAFDPVLLTTEPDLGISKGNKLVLLQRGQKARIRLIGMGHFPHAMHMHGRNFRVVAQDSVPIAEELQRVINTITVNPGEIYDIEFEACTEDECVGVWVFHCHFVFHATNNHAYPGGLVAAVAIQ